MKDAKNHFIETIETKIYKVSQSVIPYQTPFKYQLGHV